MRLKPRSIVLVCTLVALVVGAQASTASALTTPFEWRVGGLPLASSESKEFTLKSASKEVFRLVVAEHATLGFTLTSSNVKAQSAPLAPLVHGGKPGTLVAHLEFANLAVEQKGAGKGCQVTTGKLVTVVLLGEIVESAEAEKATGTVEMVLKPQSGSKVLGQFHFEKITGQSCALESFYGGAELLMEGAVLAEVSPQKAEAAAVKLVFNKMTEKFPEYVNSKGEFKLAHLETGGGGTRFVGEPEMELVSKQKFGAF